MINEYNAMNRQVDQNDEEQKWKKAQARLSITSLKKKIVSQGLFSLYKILIQCMWKIYFKMAPMSRFKLHGSLPDLCSNVVNRKNVVLFNDKISELVTEYTETPDDFFCFTKKSRCSDH